MAKAHTGHLTGSDAVISSSSGSSGSPASTASTSCSTLPPVRAHRARRAADVGTEGPGICVYAVSGGTGAHMADMIAARGCASRRSRARRKPRCTTGLIPEYLRVSNPVDCGGPPSPIAAAG